MEHGTVEREIRRLRKSLRQIESLERLDRELTSDEAQKVHFEFQPSCSTSLVLHWAGLSNSPSLTPAPPPNIPHLRRYSRKQQYGAPSWRDLTISRRTGFTTPPSPSRTPAVLQIAAALTFYKMTWLLELKNPLSLSRPLFSGLVTKTPMESMESGSLSPRQPGGL